MPAPQAVDPTSATKQQGDILEAARLLLASGGPQALRVRDIAERAGCTTMTVYSRFGGKDGILEAIYIDGFTRFEGALRDAAVGSGLEGAHRLAMTYRTWALENPGSYQVMFTEAVPGFVPSEGANAVALGSFQVLVDCVQTLQHDGQVRSGDPIEIAWALWGMSHGLVMLELGGINPGPGSTNFESIYVAALRAILDGHRVYNA